MMALGELAQEKARKESAVIMEAEGLSSSNPHGGYIMSCNCGRLAAHDDTIRKFHLEGRNLSQIAVLIGHPNSADSIAKRVSLYFPEWRSVREVRFDLTPWKQFRDITLLLQDSALSSEDKLQKIQAIVREIYDVG